uniref:RRM domain-containing protein n=1 Tax=Chromera velia CCMP2878 TaxID=1169474 RepID=A0A0G4HXS1_9ALVE|eukprot:Cvel_9332.t1-p1 / transcript=Cvel_9332.t1 / gene=Cvel_9332 / organism=Chromera_velia_CCMP2878 / gene_product=RNA methyltransferase-like protein 1A, putative / transcript_product=RNA methyltransferase-like protein 1A, putative / location=Cvel_scaffold535:46620-55373(-) / protein_length=906 / sequence_SO=supercontig / SO=protein_coding / is_pseudo=false
MFRGLLPLLSLLSLFESSNAFLVTGGNSYRSGPSTVSLWSQPIQRERLTFEDEEVGKPQYKKKERDGFDGGDGRDDNNPIYIYSPTNPRIKLVKSLLDSRRQRKKEKSFVLEGHRLILDALDSGVVPSVVFFSDKNGKMEGPQGKEILEKIRRAKGDPTDVCLVSSDIFENCCSETETPQGVAAICSRPSLSSMRRRQDEAAGKRAETVLIADDIRDPGNLGALIRSASAFGCSAVLCVRGADPWNPKTLRGGMGGHFRLPWGVLESPDWERAKQLLSTTFDIDKFGIAPRGGEETGEVEEGQKKKGYLRLATVSSSASQIAKKEKGKGRGGSDTEKTVPYFSVDWKAPGVHLVCVGNEGRGLSEDVLTELGGEKDAKNSEARPTAEAIHIPMASGVESLNAAAAAARKAVHSLGRRDTWRRILRQNVQRRRRTVLFRAAQTECVAVFSQPIIKESCPFRLLPCPHCNEPVPSKGSKRHLHLRLFCKKVPVVCPYGCGESSTREKLGAHLETECVEAEVECGVSGCGERMKWGGMKEHEEHPEVMKKHIKLLSSSLSAATEENAEVKKKMEETAGENAQGRRRQADLVGENVQVKRKMAELTEKNRALKKRETQAKQNAEEMKNKVARLETQLRQLGGGISAVPAAVAAPNAGQSGLIHNNMQRQMQTYASGSHSVQPVNGTLGEPWWKRVVRERLQEQTSGRNGAPRAQPLGQPNVGTSGGISGGGANGSAGGHRVPPGDMPWWKGVLPPAAPPRLPRPAAPPRPALPNPSASSRLNPLQPNAGSSGGGAGALFPRSLPVDVGRSSGGAGGHVDTPTWVTVSNLSVNCNQADLANAFASVGRVLQCVVSSVHSWGFSSSSSSGSFHRPPSQTARMLFSSQEAARRAVQEYNGGTLGGSVLTVSLN